MWRIWSDCWKVVRSPGENGGWRSFSLSFRRAEKIKSDSGETVMTWQLSRGGLIICFIPRTTQLITPAVAHARMHARKHRHLLLCDGETGVVRRAIIAIHSKDDLPCPSPSPPLWRRSGLSLLWPLMKFQRRDPLGLRVLLHLLPLRTYREIALGISLSPLLCLILWLWDLDLQLLPVHGQALWETFSKYW